MNARRARALLDAEPRVLVIGDLMLDRYVRGTVDRVSPEAPVPVVRVLDTDHGLGGAANVAANLVGVGARTSVIGVVGSDASGAELTEGLRQLGANTVGLLTDPERPTTTKTRLTAARHQVARFDEESDTPITGDVEQRVVEAVREGATKCDVIVVEDYDKGVLTPAVVDAAMAAGQAIGAPIVVDPKRRNFFAYGGATVFKPNERELREALGEPVRAADVGWMERAHRRVGARHLLLTRGADGMALFDEDGLALLPAATREVYDVSGAGDTVTALLAVALAGGATAREAAELANAGAALTVGRPGVSPVARQDLLSALPTEDAELSHTDPDHRSSTDARRHSR